MADNTSGQLNDSVAPKKDASAESPGSEASRRLYATVDPARCDGAGAAGRQAAPGNNFVPDAYSSLPPYLLEEIGRRTGDSAFSNAAKLAEEMQSHGPFLRPRNKPSEDYKGAREVYDAKARNTHPGDKARFEGEPPAGDTDVDNAYDFTGVVREFYQKEYNRNSIDGNGMKLISTVNFRENPKEAFNNAFWNGSQMTYGRPDEASPFKTLILRDITAHEITHGVTENESRLEYWGQAGALNESLSDVYAELIDQYADKQTADQADWLVGAGIWNDKIKGKALRDMLNPGTAYDDPKVGKDPQPADMAHYKKTFQDNGGVHINSGIPNRAFAIFARAVGGYAWEDPGHIWFAARKAAGNDPSFAQFAYQTIEAAKALGKPDEVEKLQKAWEEVGVKPSATEKELYGPPPEYRKKAG
jgi:Zn-dependent metalloprotease